MSAGDCTVCPFLLGETNPCSDDFDVVSVCATVWPVFGVPGCDDIDGTSSEHFGRCPNSCCLNIELAAWSNAESCGDVVSAVDKAVETLGSSIGRVASF